MFHTVKDLPYRILLMLVNIFFPPLAVMMLTGLGADTALNCLLFLLAVIPSHVHGFYLSWMYFWRRRKVRKGRWPGPPLSMIVSKNVTNGGLSDREVARLYREEKGLERKGLLRGRVFGERGAGSGADAFLGRQGSKRVGRSRAGSQRSAVSSASGRERDFERERRWAQQVAQDGYGPVLVQDESSSPALGASHHRTGSGVKKRGGGRVSNAHLAQLQRGARHASNPELRTPPEETQSDIAGNADMRSSLTGTAATISGNILPSFENTSPTENGLIEQPPTQLAQPGTRATTPDDPARLGIDLVAETEHDSCNRSATGDQHFTNPLVNGPPAFTADEFGQQSYLGTSSNWSFGRRVLVMVHESLFGLAPPPGRLLFEGQAYDIDWHGASLASMTENDTTIVLPTTDFAMFLINTVKFRCGQLFHLFDEETFMQSFSKFHGDEVSKQSVGALWYAHYLLVLALGKALVVVFTKGTKPPGSDLFVEGMRMLPDVGLTTSEPIQSMEILCCAALYLQCLDKRKAAYNQASPITFSSLVEGMHTDMRNRNLADPMRERCREIWWTIYILDSHMSALMGVPQSLAEHDVTAQLPEFSTSSSKSLALGIHVKLARATSSILQTIYGKEGRDPGKFLHSIKSALRNLANIHDDRVASFRIYLGNSSISRLSAYLLLFQHQCIILATRPLLFHFWQRRLASPRPVHVPSSGGARSLVRICLGAAQQIMRTLEVLQSQSLLESLVPFDLESTCDEARQIAYAILAEMVARGNRVASFYKEELELLEHHLRELASGAQTAMNYDVGTGPASNSNSDATGGFDSVFSTGAQSSMQEWYFDDGMLDGEQLMRAADSLDLDAFQWYTESNFEGLDASLL
ncbi:hypothetical protein Q7P37_003793 [Cladosporium fusiforme]